MKRIVKVGVVSELVIGIVIVLYFILAISNYNLLDTLIFCSFGVVSGLIGMGFVKLHKI